VTVKVIVLAVGVAVAEETVKQLAEPAIRLIVTLTELTHVLNLNPVGAVKTIVPGCISLFTHSARLGPFNVVYAPPTESAEIAAPPPATVVNIEK